MAVQQEQSETAEDLPICRTSHYDGIYYFNHILIAGQHDSDNWIQLYGTIRILLTMREELQDRIQGR